jgi:hypothetical protein
MHDVCALRVAHEDVVLVGTALCGSGEVGDDVCGALGLGAQFEGGWVVDFVGRCSGEQGFGCFVDRVADDDSIVGC